MKKLMALSLATGWLAWAQEPEVFHLMTKKDTAAKIPRLTVTGNVPVALIRIIDSHLVLEPFGGKVSGTGEACFCEIALHGDNYVGFRAPNEVPGNIVWTLPPMDGTNGQVLATKGTGDLYWSTASGSALVVSGTFLNLPEGSKIAWNDVPIFGRNDGDTSPWALPTAVEWGSDCC